MTQILWKEMEDSTTPSEDVSNFLGPLGFMGENAAIYFPGGYNWCRIE